MCKSCRFEVEDGRWNYLSRFERRLEDARYRLGRRGGTCSMTQQREDKEVAHRLRSGRQYLPVSLFCFHTCNSSPALRGASDGHA
jgi:hypothetical protein